MINRSDAVGAAPTVFGDGSVWSVKPFLASQHPRLAQRHRAEWDVPHAEMVFHPYVDRRGHAGCNFTVVVLEDGAYFVAPIIWSATGWPLGQVDVRCTSREQAIVIAAFEHVGETLCPSALPDDVSLASCPGANRRIDASEITWPWDISLPVSEVLGQTPDPALEQVIAQRSGTGAFDGQ